MGKEERFVRLLTLITNILEQYLEFTINLKVSS